MLSCAKQLPVIAPEPDGPATYFDMIACDKDIALVLLLLTGSVEGAKTVVREYLATFEKYAFLWQKDLATEYAKFMATNPTLEVGLQLVVWSLLHRMLQGNAAVSPGTTVQAHRSHLKAARTCSRAAMQADCNPIACVKLLISCLFDEQIGSQTSPVLMCVVLQAFEGELRNYMAVENEIGQIAALHQIGSLSLETGPLRASLKSEAASWKAQFARNLHKQGADDLKVG